jgi:hypothetical protein
MENLGAYNPSNEESPTKDGMPSPEARSSTTTVLYGWANKITGSPPEQDYVSNESGQTSDESTDDENSSYDNVRARGTDWEGAAGLRNVISVVFVLVCILQAHRVCGLASVGSQVLGGQGRAR